MSTVQLTPVFTVCLTPTPVIVVGHNEYQGLGHNGWQVTPILTSAFDRLPPAPRNFLRDAFSIEHKSTLHFNLLAVVIMNSYSHGIVDHPVYYLLFLAVKGEISTYAR
uniref:Uncharacterized protein n=1 Tax=Romanomermis culicivorax TaxID=13658 RepID=A0A915JHW0_ROMCU